MQRTEYHQHLLRVLPQRNGSAIDSQEIICIKPPDKLHRDFAVVNQQFRPVEMRFQNLPFEIRHGAERIGFLPRLRILKHDQSGLIIDIRQGKSRRGQVVEELLLRTEVILDRFMVIQMVAREVREDTPIERQPGDAFLVDGVRADLHENILTTRLCHLGDERMKRQRVRRRMLGRNRFILYIIANRRD